MVASTAASRCPDHPESAATLKCARCGKLLCERCAASTSPPECLDCSLREPDVVGNDPPLTVGFALGQSATLLSALGQQLLLGMLILFGAQVILAVLFGSSHLGAPSITRTIELVTGAVYAVYVMCLARERRAGHDPKVGFCLQQTVKLAPVAVTVTAGVALTTIFGLVFFVLPGLYTLSRYAVAPAVAVFEPTTKAGPRAAALSKGHAAKTIVLGLIQTVLLVGFPSARTALSHALSGVVPTLPLVAVLYAVQWTAAAYAALIGFSMYTGLVAAARKREAE